MTFEKLSDLARAIEAAVPAGTTLVSVNLCYVEPAAIAELRPLGQRHEVQCWIGSRGKVTEVMDVPVGRVRFGLFAERDPNELDEARHEQGLCGCAARKRGSSDAA